VEAPQRCLCGGEARVLKLYQPQKALILRQSSPATGYLVHCDVCAAMTLRHDTQVEAERAWLERRCPLTFEGVSR
jgi:hypothetical protein